MNAYILLNLLKSREVGIEFETLPSVIFSQRVSSNKFIIRIGSTSECQTLQ